MRTPQLENGYLKIANEIVEALCLYDLTGLELRCILFIMRKTYGYNKKKDNISNSQFADGLGIHRPNVPRLLRGLVEGGVITQGVLVGDNGCYQPRCYQINKKVLSRVIHTKDNTKDNIYTNKKNMDRSFEDEVITVDSDGDEIDTPVKSKPKVKKPVSLYIQVAVYYCSVMGKRSAVSQYKAAKEIAGLALEDFPKDSKEEHLKEIKGRIDIAFKHYERIGCTWGLGKVGENWDIILKEWQYE